MRNSKLALSLCCVFFSFAGAAHAADSPQFLGANRNGICTETGLISTFPKEGPEVVWKTSLGVGMSGLAIADGTVYTMTQNEADQMVVALNAVTGEKKWETKISEAYENEMGHGPRATPTVHAGVVYTFSGEGLLTALKADDGSIIWNANVVKQLLGKTADYGMASSPLVAGEVVVVQTGSRNGAVAAFDLKTGDRKWAVGHDVAGYSSPILATLAGKQQVVAFTGNTVFGIAHVDGTQLWSYEFETEYNCNTASPVVLNENSVLISAGENHGSAVLKIAADGDQFSVEEGWTSLGVESVLRAEWQTPVLVDGHIFGLDNIGSAGQVTNLVCVRASDGEQLWNEKRFGKANMIYADGKLFFTTMRGEIGIVTASTEAFEETARYVTTDRTRQAPVIVNGKLYVRDDSGIVCINVKAAPAEAAAPAAD
ncbi:MAG: PQQ-binding-like beta-propeller repeat protein [Fuerstiella sp.]